MALTSTLDVGVSDEVEFALTVENTGDDPVELTFRSGLKADFAVEADGEEVWRASDGQMFTQALQSETIDPGESSTYPGRWPNPESGTYTGVAELNVTERDVETRAEFSV